MFAVPDKLTVFIHGLDTMIGNVMFYPFIVKIMEKKVVITGKADPSERQADQFVLYTVQKGKLKLTLAELGVPVNSVE